MGGLLFPQTHPTRISESTSSASSGLGTDGLVDVSQGNRSLCWDVGPVVRPGEWTGGQEDFVDVETFRQGSPSGSRPSVGPGNRRDRGPHRVGPSGGRCPPTPPSGIGVGLPPVVLPFLGVGSILTEGYEPSFETVILPFPKADSSVSPDPTKTWKRRLVIPE